MLSLISQAGIDYLVRWGHMLAGVAWIGLLYYFNFVQTEYFKVADPTARNDAFVKLVPRALLWFRMAAAVTFLTGLVLLGIIGSGLSLDITIGAAKQYLLIDRNRRFTGLGLNNFPRQGN